MLKVEVVIESLRSGRTDVEPGIGPKAKHGGGEQVRAGVPQSLEFAHLVAFLEGLALNVVFGGFHFGGVRLAKRLAKRLKRN